MSFRGVLGGYVSCVTFVYILSCRLSGASLRSVDRVYCDDANFVAEPAPGGG